MGRIFKISRAVYEGVIEMNKIGLVLEGGGMRGAYTAGALCWLIDHDIEFDYGVAISAGAVHLCNFIDKNKKNLYDFSVTYVADKRNVGLIPFFKEGSYVGYDFMFDHILRDTAHFDIENLVNYKTHMEIGVYDLEQGKTNWYLKEDFKNDLQLLKAACTLPIAGKIVHYKWHKFIDGGVTTMVPINRSIEHGNNKHFVIITKDENYVRKPSGKGMDLALNALYHPYQQLREDMKKRTPIYYEEMDKVKELCERNEAILLRPTKNLGVSRFKGDHDQLKALFQLGYQDLEDRKEEIFAFLQD